MIMEYHQRLTNRVHPVITEAGDNIVGRYSFVNEIINLVVQLLCIDKR